MKPEVSVIVPVTKEGDTTKAMKGLDNQVYKDFEVIIERSDGNAAVNRNKGIRESRGKYIAFCDADDYWYPEKLFTQMMVFEGNSPGLICSGHLYGDAYSDNPHTFESLVWKNWVVTSSVVVPRKVLDNVGVFDERPDLARGEDYDLWIRIVRHYSAIYISLPLVRYKPSKIDYKESRRLDKLVYESNIDNISPELYKRRMRRLLLQRLNPKCWI